MMIFQKLKMMMRRGLKYSLLVLLFLCSCKTIFSPSPYASYVKALESSGLASTEMGKSWINSGKEILLNPNEQLDFPFKEEVFFRRESPSAVAYKIVYEKSNKLKFTISSDGKPNEGLFLDLFEGASTPRNLINELINDTSFVYENSSDQILILRLQPHLLVNHHAILEIALQPKLAFPVQGGNNKDIKSFWGVDRDGGARKHEGVDIFNKRGTPVLAVDDGVISRVQVTQLGGKVVWQRLGLLGASIYYAHLDSQLVTVGDKVKRGQVLGLMGNTGNAITTSPHLHFGIYTMGGAIDPINYILRRDSVPGKVKAEVKYLGEEVMIAKNDQVIPITILAVATSGITYKDDVGRVSYTSNLKRASSTIKFKPTMAPTYIYSSAGGDKVPLGKFDPKQAYQVLGYVQDSVYLAQQNIRGWVAQQ